MKRIITLSLLIILLVLLIPISVQADAPHDYLLIAAYNAPQEVKDIAGYSCNGSNDYTIISTALSLGAGKTVTLSEGDFNLSSYVTIPSDTTFQGTSLLTHINMSANNHAFYTSNNDRITIRDIWIDGTDTSSKVGIYFESGASDIVVEGCKINGWYRGINLAGSNRTKITNNSFADNVYAAIYGYNADNSIIEANYSNNDSTNGVAGSISLEENIGTSQSVGCKILNNIIDNAVGDAIYIRTTGGCTVEGNMIYHSIHYGIDFENTSNLKIIENTFIGDASKSNLVAINSFANSPINQYITIQYNTISGYDRPMHLEKMNYSDVSHNLILEAGDSWDGIAIYKSSYNLISHNTCLNAHRYGIYVLGDSNTPSNYNLIEGNICYDNQGTKTQQYGIYEGSYADYNSFFTNQVYGNIYSSIHKQGANSISEHNVG